MRTPCAYVQLTVPTAKTTSTTAHDVQPTPRVGRRGATKPACGYCNHETRASYLGVGDDAHDLGVLLDTAELSVDLLRGVRELLGVPGERLLLRSVPVLVEPSRVIIVDDEGGKGGGD